MKRAIVLIVLSALVLSGCAAKATESAASVGRDAANYEMPAAAEEMAVESEYAADGQAAGVTSGSAEPRRLVIQNANMSIVVVKPLDAMNKIAAMATEFSGFVVSSNTYTVTTSQGEDVIEANITVRVDSAKLDVVMERIRQLTPNAEEDVLSENISGEDVTKDYVDLESRLRNLEETETQLQAIMDQATETEDVLAVYRELSSIREEIEVVTGQMKYYEESAALSSISVYIQAVEAVQPIQVGGWKPVGTARDAIQALLDTLEFLAKAAIWIVIYILPVVVVIGLPIWLIVRAIRKARRNARARKLQEAPAETKK